MSTLKSVRKGVTAEQVMLLAFLVMSAVFIIEPVVENYPDDARVFPQLTASVVFIGSLLLLLQNYLPDPLYKFVTDSVSITSSDEDTIEADKSDQEDETTADEEYKKDTIGAEYGYEVNETVFMVSTAILYFIAGWSAGFLFVTPVYILAYTLWFRVHPVLSVGLAVLGMLVIYLFMTYLVLPFDQGHIFDFSPLLPLFLDASAMFPGGGA